MKLVISNNTEKIKISSDQLFRSQIEKKFYLNKQNFNDLYFMYYGTPIYYKDYLKEFGNIDNDRIEMKLNIDDELIKLEYKGLLNIK